VPPFGQNIEYGSDNQNRLPIIENTKTSPLQMSRIFSVGIVSILFDPVFSQYFSAFKKLPPWTGGPTYTPKFSTRVSRWRNSAVSETLLGTTIQMEIFTSIPYQKLRISRCTTVRLYSHIVNIIPIDNKYKC
jgi:hypothetical protein